MIFVCLWALKIYSCCVGAVCLDGINSRWFGILFLSRRMFQRGDCYFTKYLTADIKGFLSASIRVNLRLKYVLATGY